MKTRDRRSECSSQGCFYHTVIITWQRRHYKYVGPPPAVTSAMRCYQNSMSTKRHSHSKIFKGIMIWVHKKHHWYSWLKTLTQVHKWLGQRECSTRLTTFFHTHTHTQWFTCVLLKHHRAYQPVLADVSHSHLSSHTFMASQRSKTPVSLGSGTLQI